MIVECSRRHSLVNLSFIEGKSFPRMSEVASYLVTSACVCVCMCVERKDCPKQRQDGSVGRSVKSVYLWDVVCVRARECERGGGGEVAGVGSSVQCM